MGAFAQEAGAEAYAPFEPAAGYLFSVGLINGVGVPRPVLPATP